MGEMRVPAAALYGAQTARAVENFPDQRPALSAIVHPRAGADQERGGQGQRQAALPIEQRRATEVACEGRHDDSVRGRYFPDRQRHLHQHERQRGDRRTWPARIPTMM